MSRGQRACVVAGCAFVSLMAVYACAHAAPPSPGDPQGELLAPYDSYIKGMNSPVNGQGCCSRSDCRAAEYRINEHGDAYEAFLDDKTWAGAPNAWVLVPPQVVRHDSNPTGYGIACWATWHHDPDPQIGNWFCFTPASGV